MQVRSMGVCEICGHPAERYERHHRQRRREGADSFENVLRICVPCHHHVTAHPAEARKYGWIVSVSREPAVIPVLYQRKEWLYLDAAGGLLPAFDVTDAHE